MKENRAEFDKKKNFNIAKYCAPKYTPWNSRWR